MNKHDQCGLCGLIGFVVRRTWNLNERPHIDIAGITCELHSVAIGKFGAYECSDIGIPDGVLPARRDVCHRLRITTSGAPNEVVDALKAARVSYLPEIQLLEEDAFKVGRTKELHGRRVGETVDIGLLKRWIHTCENEHRENCETAWWRPWRDPAEKRKSPGCISHGYRASSAIMPLCRSQLHLGRHRSGVLDNAG